MKKQRICILVALFGFYLLLFSCENKSKDNYDIKNTDLNCNISLGIDKDKVNKLLGEPTLSDDWFVYKDNLFVGYTDSKMDFCVIVSDKWKTKKDITVGSSVDEIISAYGESNQHENIIGYFLDKTGSICKSDEASTFVMFNLDGKGEKVENIIVSLSDN